MGLKNRKGGLDAYSDDDPAAAINRSPSLLRDESG